VTTHRHCGSDGKILQRLVGRQLGVKSDVGHDIAESIDDRLIPLDGDGQFRLPVPVSGSSRPVPVAVRTHDARQQKPYVIDLFDGHNMDQAVTRRVLMLAQAFVAEQRLLTGNDGPGLDTFAEVVCRLVREAAIQRLIDNHGFNRQTAEEVAVDMLKGFSEWE
jgi:hypothetical protein